MSKCQVQWINKYGQPTPDQNEAVMVAHYHEAKWLCSTGCENNRIIGYLENVRESFLICAEHSARITDDMRFPKGGWTFTPLEKAVQS